MIDVFHQLSQANTSITYRLLLSPTAKLGLRLNIHKEGWRSSMSKDTSYARHGTRRARNRILVRSSLVVVVAITALIARAWLDGSNGVVVARVMPSMAVTPNRAACGTGVVTVTGEGFGVGSHVTISVAASAGAGTTVTKTTTSPTGTFSVQLLMTELHPECRGAEPHGGIQTLVLSGDTGWGPKVGEPFTEPSATVELPFYSGVSQAFQRTWERTDSPVAEQGISRTWIWGPSANTGPMLEEYVGAPDGLRFVQYYDKSRMEVTDPSLPMEGLWYVTNGLLVNELTSGQIQIGDSTFRDHPDGPADIPIVGDLDGVAPTYATIAAAQLRSMPPQSPGDSITHQLNRDGTVTTNDQAATYGVTAAHQVTVPNLNHTVASVFWEFMTTTSTIVHDGETIEGDLVPNPFYATGYPITEAYWTQTTVDGSLHDILLQCFERRCLSYTPTNPEGWQVEAGNVGLHYRLWRYAYGT